MITIVEQIYNYAKNNKDKIAISDGKVSLTYLDLISSVVKTKKILSEQFHLKKNDVVVIAADKQIEFVSLYLSCHLLGVIVVPISPDTNIDRFNCIVGDVSPKLCFGFKNDTVINYDFSEFTFNGESLDFDDLIYPSGEDLADLMFTTGTTGKPKVVKLTHMNISAAAFNINSFIMNTDSDIELLALPISHSFGLGRMRCALSKGQTLILLGNFANIKRFYRIIEKFKVTGFGMVPSSWALIKKLSGIKLKDYAEQIKYIEIGSAPMPLEEKLLLSNILPNTRICMHYGLTEASRSCFLEFHLEKEYINSVGRPTPNVEVSVKDAVGKDVCVGECGEICVRGCSVSPGYLNEDKSLSFFSSDWFRTGDYGYIDDNGYLFLLSRMKEIINVGGKKVSPYEVESVLLSCEFISDCACVGVPDAGGVLGSVVVAYIVSNSPEKIIFENMENFIGNKLEIYKHPVKYYLVDQIPRTSSGKIQRLLLNKE